MRLFLDSAKIARLRPLLSTGVFYGVTTNPLILKESGLKPEDLPPELPQGAPLHFGSISLVLEPTATTLVVDTVGAGDACMAALLVSLYRSGSTSRQRLALLGHEQLSSLLSFAAKVAALTCVRSGADPAWQEEVM